MDTNFTFTIGLSLAIAVFIGCLFYFGGLASRKQAKFTVLIVFFGFLLFSIMLNTLPSTKINREYSNAFRKSVNESAEKPNIEYTGQNKLKYLEKGKWNNKYIPEKYISQSPNDLRGIVTYKTLKESRRNIGSYVGRRTLTVLDGYLTIYDPFANKIVYEGIIPYDGGLPEKIHIGQTSHPSEKAITNMIEIHWQEYLLETLK